MTTKLVEWVSNGGQITKSELSDGRRAKFLPSITELTYNWSNVKGYLGNDGSVTLQREKFLLELKN